MSLLRRRKPINESEASDSKPRKEKEEDDRQEDEDGNDKNKRKIPSSKIKKKPPKWSCFDSCCWFIGCICVTWWILLFLYNAMPASFPQYVTEAITGPLQDPPGEKLKKEGLEAKHPVVFVPGIVTGGLELWEGRKCADGLFRKRLWGGTFGEVYKRCRIFGCLIFLLVVLCFPFNQSLIFGKRALDSTLSSC